MKRAMDIISLWSNWKPSLAYPCPSQVAHYYWTAYMATQKNEPFFPQGDINDLAAVLAKTKPAAMVDIQKDNMLMKELAEISLKQGIFSRHLIKKSMLIFSQEDILNEIQEALEKDDKYTLGILLGYPQKSVDDFIAKLGHVKLASHKLDEEYIASLPQPEFKPGPEWFECVV